MTIMPARKLAVTGDLAAALKPKPYRLPLATGVAVPGKANSSWRPFFFKLMPPCRASGGKFAVATEAYTVAVVWKPQHRPRVSSRI